MSQNVWSEKGLLFVCGFYLLQIIVASFSTFDQNIYCIIINRNYSTKQLKDLYVFKEAFLTVLQTATVGYQLHIVVIH